MITLSSIIVDLVKSMISLLSCCVPNDEFDLLVLEFDCAIETGGIDRALLLFVESIPAEPHGEGRLADTRYQSERKVHSPSTTIFDWWVFFSILSN